MSTVGEQRICSLYSFKNQGYKGLSWIQLVMVTNEEKSSLECLTEAYEYSTRRRTPPSHSQLLFRTSHLGSWESAILWHTLKIESLECLGAEGEQDWYVSESLFIATICGSISLEKNYMIWRKHRLFRSYRF